MAWRTHILAGLGPTEGFEVPLLDVDTPGRISCVWQQDGVWICLWYVDRPAPSTPVTRPRRWFPGGRFPFTRNHKKESARA